MWRQTAAPSAHEATAHRQLFSGNVALKEEPDWLTEVLRAERTERKKVTWAHIYIYIFFLSFSMVASAWLNQANQLAQSRLRAYKANP